MKIRSGRRHIFLIHTNSGGLELSEDFYAFRYAEMEVHFLDDIVRKIHHINHLRRAVEKDIKCKRLGSIGEYYECYGSKR